MIPHFVCRHDNSLAAAAVSTPNGCVAFPEDKQQFLCAQHYISVWDGTDGDFDEIWVDEWLAANL